MAALTRKRRCQHDYEWLRPAPTLILVKVCTFSFYDMKSSLCPFTCSPTRLSHDILQMRLNCLRAERRQLGYLLFVTATLGLFVWGGDYQDGPVACRET